MIIDGISAAKAIMTEILNALPDFCKPVVDQIRPLTIKNACKGVSNTKKKFQNGDGAGDFSACSG